MNCTRQNLTQPLESDGWKLPFSETYVKLPGCMTFCQICWKMMEPKDLSFWKASFSGFHVRFVGGNSC